jgi:hypothetical protein
MQPNTYQIPKKYPLPTYALQNTMQQGIQEIVRQFQTK